MKGHDLKSFCKEHWLAKTDDIDILFRIYSMVGINSEQLRITGDKLFNTLNKYSADTFIGFGEYENETFKIYINKIYSNLLGYPVYKVHEIQEDLPKGLYVFLTTYVEHEKFGEAEIRLNRAEAFLSSCLGNHFIHHRIAESIVNVRSNNEKAITPTIYLPKPCQGPHFIPNNLDYLSEIFEKRGMASQEIREKIELAMDFIFDALNFGTTTNESIRFVMYRSALEVLIGKEDLKKAQPIFKKIYKTEDLQSWGVKHIWVLRHKIIHKGIKIIFSQEDEGYMQAMVMDCIDFVLGRESERHASEYMTAFNYDPKKLGSDSRIILQFRGDTPG